MKTMVRLRLAFRRSEVSLEIAVRSLVMDRHRAMAGLLGYEAVEEYFDDTVRRMPIEEMLTFVVAPTFAIFTRVEFAQELLEIALGRRGETPWNGDPTDMPDDEFRGLVDRWVAELTEDIDVRTSVATAAESALLGWGSDVTRQMSGLVSLLAARAGAQEEAESA